MTTEDIGTDERQARLDWMRAEFRDAQQRRYESRRPAEVTDVSEAELTLVPQARPPAPGTG